MACSLEDVGTGAMNFGALERAEMRNTNLWGCYLWCRFCQSEHDGSVSETNGAVGAGGQGGNFRVEFRGAGRQNAVDQRLHLVPGVIPGKRLQVSIGAFAPFHS